MGTRTYSRRSASGERIPTALGRRTGRFTGEPALESTNIPAGWQGRDGDVGITRQILPPRAGGIIAGITPQNYERPGRNPYFSFELAQGENEISFPLSRNANATWRELTDEAADVISALQLAVGEEGRVDVGDEGFIVNSDSNRTTLLVSQGRWELSRYDEEGNTVDSQTGTVDGIDALLNVLEQAGNTTVARAVREPRDRTQDVDEAYAKTWGEVRQAEAVARNIANRMAQVTDPAMLSRMAGQYADYYNRLRRSSGQLQAELRAYRRDNENNLPRGFAFQDGNIVGTRSSGAMTPVTATNMPTPEELRAQYGVE